MPGQRPSRRQKGPSCFCFDNLPRQNILQRDRTDFMHEQSRRLIRSWFEKALESVDAEPVDSFEPFIFAWFSVNAWAACVTGEDRDAGYMQKLISDSGLYDQFEDLMVTDSEFAAVATAFCDCWPIFSVKELRCADVRLLESGTRADVIRHYLSRKARKFEPQCWTEHHSKDEACPCDWSHTIAAIYRVRCNLFHGEKSAQSQIDQNVVHAAFRVLVQFFSKAMLL